MPFRSYYMARQHRNLERELAKTQRELSRLKLRDLRRSINYRRDRIAREILGFFDVAVMRVLEKK